MTTENIWLFQVVGEEYTSFYPPDPSGSSNNQIWDRLAKENNQI